MVNINFGSIKNGIFKYAPSPLVAPTNEHGGMWTNDAQKYLEHGYLPIEHTKIPKKDGYYYTLEHEKRGNKIVEVWIEHENPIPEPTEEEQYAEAAKILLGEAE